MTPERWKQLDELAQAALELGGDERPEFLDEACAGDDELRREVESQIAYQQQASKFLEEPAIKQAAELIAHSQTESESMEGRTISHYSILRKLGAGGMGEVYLAQTLRSAARSPSSSFRRISSRVKKPGNASLGKQRPPLLSSILISARSTKLARNRLQLHCDAVCRRRNAGKPHSAPTLALALCGEVGAAQSLADEVARQYPKATVVKAVFLPVIRAAIELWRGHPDAAIEFLQAASSYETCA